MNDWSRVSGTKQGFYDCFERELSRLEQSGVNQNLAIVAIELMTTYWSEVIKRVETISITKNA